MRGFLYVSLLLPISFLPLGCSNGYQIASVSGHVLMDNRPLANAEVRFQPTDSKGFPYSTSFTDDQGNYTLHLENGSDTPGAVVGEHRVVISLDYCTKRPGMTQPPKFGTGLHETTRLVARAIGAHGVAGKPVLDVGCGSGILRFVALALGAARARAIDIDPDSVEVTNENAVRNGVAIETSTDPIESIEGSYPVVLANIEARILIPMARDLGARVDQGGLLLLSGILVPQKDDVLAAYPDFDLLEAPSLGEWILLALRKK